MQAITPLTVVNACIKSMGETPLNSLDSDHPYVQAALNILAEVNTLEQEVGWWFNTDYPTLSPDPGSGFIYVPADTLNLELSDPSLVQRGNRLWDTINNTFVIGRDVNARLIREITFENLPKNVQQLISMRAQLDFQSAFDADDSKYKKLYGAYNQAYTRVRRMHIRNQGVNMFNAPSAARALSRIRPAGAASGLYPNRIR